MSDYITLTLKISKEDIKEFLLNFYDEEQVENMNMEREASEAVSGVLQNEFSDFFVVDRDTVIVGDFD